MNRTPPHVAQTSKSAVSRVSKPANRTTSNAPPIWKSAIQQVGKPALLLAVVAMNGCNPPAASETSKKPEPSLSVKLVQPKRGDIIRSVSLPANVTANQQATLYSKAAGYLKTIAVDKGDVTRERRAR